jgi:hypothetical protein
VLAPLARFQVIPGSGVPGGSVSPIGAKTSGLKRPSEVLFFPFSRAWLGELAFKGVFSVGFPASLLGGFPCDSGPLTGR